MVELLEGLEGQSPGHQRCWSGWESAAFSLGHNNTLATLLGPARELARELVLALELELELQLSRLLLLVVQQQRQQQRQQSLPVEHAVPLMLPTHRFAVEQCWCHDLMHVAACDGWMMVTVAAHAILLDVHLSLHPAVPRHLGDHVNVTRLISTAVCPSSVSAASASAAVCCHHAPLSTCV